MTGGAGGRSADGVIEVVHLGPSTGTAGGMGVVLESYERLVGIAPFRLRLVPTFHPAARAWSVRLFVSAGLELLRTRRRRGSTIAHIHLSEGGSFLREGALGAVAKVLGFAVVMSLHGAYFDEFSRRRPGLVRRVLALADVVCPLGPGGAARVRALAGGDAPAIVTLPNPAELPSLTTPPPEEDVVLFAGEVGTRKGVDVLLAAWPAVRARRPGATLLVAGPPGDVPPRPLDGVCWLGPLCRDEVQRHLDEARVAVLPSRAEVMPMFLLEAMGRRRPVVATDVGEVRWTVGDGGRVVPPEDVAALTSAIVELLEDRGMSCVAADAGRERAESVFSSSAVARELVALYSSLDH